MPSRDYYIIGSSSLNTLRAYFVLSLGLMDIVTSKLIKDKHSVVRILLLQCSFLCRTLMTILLAACCLSR